MRYTAASFFSGIGGIDLAFSLVGFDIRVQVEVDAYCRKVLWKNRKYWQNARQLKDIKNVTKAEVGEVDVMFGGFPCQDISIAGKRAGITRETRSGLWFEFLRLIRQVRPKVVVLENVAAIHVPTTDDNGYQQPSPAAIVTATLTEVGYDCIWLPIRASDIGAPHQRERWFCVAFSKSNSIRRDHRRYSWRKRYLLHHTNRYAAQGKSKWQGRVRRVSKIGKNRVVHTSCQRTATGQQSGQGYGVECSGQELGNTTSESGYAGKHHTGNRAQRKAVSQLRNTGGKRNMVNTQCARLEGSTQSKVRKSSIVTKRYWRQRCNTRTRTQSRLGRAAHGVSSRMVGLGDEHRGRFPARPNEQQYDYEPSRVTGRKDQRRDRLKALGNAVVPQQVLPIAMAVKAFLEGKG